MDIRLAGLVPVVRASGDDYARSAAGRLAGETVLWVPQALTPAVGARWHPVDDHRATVVLDGPSGAIPVEVTVAEDGRLESVAFQRWQDSVDPPAPTSFGGPVHDELVTRDGVRIARSGSGGWHWGERRIGGRRVLPVPGHRRPAPALTGRPRRRGDVLGILHFAAAQDDHAGGRPPRTPMAAELDDTWRSGLDVLVAQLPVGVVILADDGSLVYGSERFRAITGVGADGEAARPGGGAEALVAAVHPQDRDELRLALPELLTGASVELTLRWLHADGSVRWATTRTGAARGPAGGVQAVIGVVEDVTDLRELTRTWGDRQLMFDAVLANSSDLVVVVDPVGRLSFVSAAARRILGRDPQAWIGRDVFDLLHPDDLGYAAEALGGSVESGPGVKDPIVVRVRHADGSWRKVEIVANNLIDVEHVGGLVVTARDITERVAAEAVATEARDRFERAFDGAPIGMALTSIDGTLVRVNAAMSEIVGRPRHALTGRSLFRFVLDEDREHMIERATQLLADDEALRGVELRFVRSDGEVAWARASATMLRDDAGAALHAIVHLEDVTEQRLLRERLEHAATHDPLTGLLNRAGFSSRFAAAFTAAGGAGSVLLVDLDGFKAVNDAHGHAAGDELLRLVAARLRGGVRADDLVGRFGGDEFSLYAPELRDAGRAIALGEATREALGAPYVLQAGTVRIAASVGVALLDGSVELADALAAADAAAYRAKRSGGDRVELSWHTELGAPS